MSPEGKGRQKASKRLEILIIPTGDKGGRTKSFKTSPVKLWLLVLLGVVASGAVIVTLLVFTPFGYLFPISDPVWQEKYDKDVIANQIRIDSLAEQVFVLRDYNLQLRKALGDQGGANAPAAGEVPLGIERSLARGERDDTPPVTQSPEMDDPRMPNAGDFSAGSVVYRPMEFESVGLGGTFPLLVPTQGFVSQRFDPSRKHFGVDFAAKIGTPVFAASPGEVVFSGWTYEDGNMLIVAHSGGYRTVYKHNKTLLKNAFASVKRGEVVALVGSSGRSSKGPHLHFEVWKDGIPVDPDEFWLVSSKTIKR